MRYKPLSGLVIALALASCATPMLSTAPSRPGDASAPSDLPHDGQLYANGNSYRVMAVDELPIVGVSVDSQAGTMTAQALADGDLSTAWANGGYRNPTAWASVALAQTASLASVGIKMGPSPAGTSYDLQVSDDGAQWTTVASGLTNTTWGLETKPLPAGTSGKFVRVFWHNNASAPVPHFAIYELEVNGAPTAASSPPPSPAPSAVPTAPPSPTPLPSASAPASAGSSTPIAVSADSSYASLDPSLAVDGNLSTQWSSGGYQAAEAWLQLDFGAVRPFSQLALKTGALPSGVSYQLELSADGQQWTPVGDRQTNTTWQLETKPFVGQGRYVRVHFYNNPSQPIARFSVFELQVDGQANSAGTPTPTSTPSTPPSSTPTPAPSSAPTSVPVGVTPNPGPGAARGQCLVNGAGVSGISIQLIGPSGTITTTTDAQGYFTATQLAPGNYYAHYYNASDRNKIGYWNSLSQRVDATTGAAYPPVDLYQKGMTNTPPMDARVGLPQTFSWVLQTQPVQKIWFRVHTHPFTSYQLFYQSPTLPGTSTSYTWDGSGMLLPLDTGNRYFWGIKWDAGPVGVGGNLYQAVYFN